MTAQKVDNLTQTRRAEEERIKALLKYKNESQRLINTIKNENQMILHCNNSNEKKSNVEIDDKRRRKEQDDVRRERLAKKEEEEERIEQVKRDEALQKEQIEREIQRICESSDELKELERNIKIAYVNKERAAQHQESLLMKRIENAREELIEQHMEEQRRAKIKQEDVKDSMRRDRLVKQKIQLQEQMRENEVSRLSIQRINKSLLIDQTVLTLFLFDVYISCISCKWKRLKRKQ